MTPTRTPIVAPLLTLFFAACAATPPPAHAPAAAGAAATTPSAAAPAPSAAPEVLTADTPRATRGGASFIAPAGWTLTANDAQVLLVSPDPDLKLAIVEVKGAATAAAADEAVKAGWAAFHPGMKWPLKVADDLPARQGWDARRAYEYETSPNEKMVVYAVALHHGDGWAVLLAEGGMASFERRQAQAGLVSQSLRPQGYERESFAGKTAHPLDAARLALVTDFVEKARAATETPGVALALIQDGKVVFAGGFGVRELGKPAKVDGDTLFIVASNTKALTTLMLAKLVDEKRFGWDTPVTQVYPAFKLGDPGVTSQVEMKHLICACTGMPRQDLEWVFSSGGATPESEMKLLGTMVPTTKFGEVFQYSNIMAAAAGFIGGHVAFPDEPLGPAYDDAMRTRVFAPLGMTHTTFDFGKALAGPHATAHGDDVDHHVALGKFDVDRSIVAARPAGGAWSSVNDMARYVMMELANGKLPDGTQYVSQENLLARRAPQVAVGEDRTYGMGLMVSKRYGTPMVHHGGDLTGYHSDMFWLPEAGVGGVILVNADRGDLMIAPVERRLLEVLFDGRAEAEDDLAHVLEEDRTAFASERPRLTVPPDAAVVAALAPAYHNDALGDVVVKRAAGSAPTLDVGEFSTAFATRKNDDGSVSLVTTDAGIVGFPFIVGQKDGKPTLTVRDAQHEYVFVSR